MLAKEIKQAIFDGAYAVTKDGTKIKYIGKTEEKDNYPLVFATYYKDNTYRCNIRYTNKFKCHISNDELFDKDIVGLWEDKPESFDLERALAGEPVRLRNGKKGYILKQIADTLIGYFDESTATNWAIDGSHSIAAESSLDIIGMGQEPENSQTQYKELPKPITEFGDLTTVWYVSSTREGYKPEFSSKDQGWVGVQRTMLENNLFMATREDAQFWCDAMSGKLKVAIID